MHDYQHILLATDLEQDGEPIAQRAADLVKRYRARFSIIHVIETVPMDLTNDMMLPQVQEIETALAERARQRLHELVQRLGVTDVTEHITNGVTKTEILTYAEENHIDLIVLGSHGRTGFARLLGSTANAVLHAAQCDVLAVRTQT